MNKGSIKNALAASLSAEESSFKTRLAKAEAVFGDPNITPQPEKPLPADASVSSGQTATGDLAPAAPGRVVRDSFTMPEDDYARINEVKTRCLQQNLPLNKSEVLRAGLQALGDLSDEQLATLVSNLQKVKTGRPAQS